MFSGSSSSNSKRGGLFIGLGWTLLGLVALDQVLQYRQEQEAKERLEILSRMQQEADEMNQVEWDTTTTTLQSLFECKIRHVEPSLDGTKILSNIRVGDVVEVLESDVGPNKAYHLCRRPAIGKRKESIGWYPHQFMDVVDD